MPVDSTKPSLAPPSTEDLWRNRVAAWRHSGKTADAFCADKPYAASTLRGWSSRLRDVPAVTFLELRPRSPVVQAPPRSELVVEVGSARVRVASGFDPALLASVVTALQGGTR